MRESQVSCSVTIRMLMRASMAFIIDKLQGCMHAHIYYKFVSTLFPIIDAGPNTVATTRDDLGPAGEELTTLYLAVNDSRAHSGGDAPEYCMSGILEAFGATYTTNENYTLSLFANGSQIIVITDAEAKDAHKSSNVIRVADESNTQINFLLTTGMSSYSLYKNISEATGGVVVYSNLEKGDELKILTDFASVRMAHERRKRKVKRIAEVDPTRMGGEAPPVANCFEYITSMFTSNVNGFVSSTAPSVKVTSPDGVTVKMSSYPTFNTYWPMPGKWKICAPSGLKLNANVQSETEINFAVSFLVESTSQFLVAEEMPSVCKYTHLCREPCAWKCISKQRPEEE